LSTIQFPKDFLWGAATSAYQVEGNNYNSDWWEWEKSAGVKDLSGLACNHYERYEEDFDLIRSLGHNCHRLSVEWSRVEPEDGVFSQKEIEHYIKVVTALKERGIEPIVTLHHFTNPLWFSKLGGWENQDASRCFLSYAERIVSALSGSVRYWVIINEPEVYLYYSYIIGIWPPQEKSPRKAKTVFDNLAKAHIAAYRLIHDIYKKSGLASPFVGTAQHIRSFTLRVNNLRNRAAAAIRDRIFNRMFLNTLIRAHALDYIGLNYYTRDIVDAQSWNINSLLYDIYEENARNIKKNDLGWDIYPEGLFTSLMSLKKYRLPVFILENGICTQNDDERWRFILSHLKKVHAAMDSGVKVIGYIYWSLMDNFEWADGFAPCFGLIEVDYRTMKRTIRESAKKYSIVCKTGILDG